MAKRKTEREALEAALVADPDDIGAHMAYADWLAENGDERDQARAEFIRVQLALEDESRSPAERKKLRQRENALLKKHRTEWLGLLAGNIPHEGANRDEWPRRYRSYSFARGWFDFAERVAHWPGLRLLRRLRTGGYADAQPTDEERRRFNMPDGWINTPALFALASSPYLGNVRVFQLGWHRENDTLRYDPPSASNPLPSYSVNSTCHQRGEAAAVLVKSMPRLEELYLFAHDVPTGELFGLRTLKNLRIMQVYHSEEYPLEILARNPTLGSLTHLLCYPGALHLGEEHPRIRIEGVRALLRSPRLHNLTHLQLRVSDVGDRGCEEIVRSGILKRLKLLDLRHGTITDEGARTLAASPDLNNLEHFELSRNRLTPEGLRVLRRVLGTRLNAQYQQTDVEVEHNTYLYEGDIE
jgi:uncharacterized protein (TIGR02996 family)